MVVSKVFGSGAEDDPLAHRARVYVNSTRPWERLTFLNRNHFSSSECTSRSASRSALRINVQFSSTDIGLKLEVAYHTLARMIS